FEAIHTNLIGAIQMTFAAYPAMQKQRSGTIVNINSVRGNKGKDTEAIYCASKFGLRGFCESLRPEAQKHGIRILEFFPGGMKTHFFDKIGRDKVEYDGFMEPKDVAQLVATSSSTPPNIVITQTVIERFSKKY
ncbi:MAG: SDR family oxidoreductase, partial [Candidatus Diapherotrites archaeon]|nr:SDR family oxidoreductase [Candidatus Diapherotrites archaeon]